MAFASMQHLSAAPNAALSQPQRSERVPAAAAFRAGQPLKLRATQQRVALAARSGHVCCAALAQAGPGKLISAVEIPAFIPRQDLMDQLLRWAVIEVQEGGAANYGTPCKVRGALWLLARAAETCSPRSWSSYAARLPLALHPERATPRPCPRSRRRR